MSDEKHIFTPVIFPFIVEHLYYVTGKKKKQRCNKRGELYVMYCQDCTRTVVYSTCGCDANAKHARDARGSQLATRAKNTVALGVCPVKPVCALRLSRVVWRLEVTKLVRLLLLLNWKRRGRETAKRHKNPASYSYSYPPGRVYKYCTGELAWGWLGAVSLWAA